MTENHNSFFYGEALNRKINYSQYSTGDKDTTSAETQTKICNSDFNTNHIDSNTMNNLDYIARFYQSKTMIPPNCSIRIVRNLNRNNLFEKKKSSLGTKSSKKQEGFLLFKNEYRRNNVLLEKEESKIEDKCIRMWKAIDKNMKKLYCLNAESIKNNAENDMVKGEK